MRHAITPPTTSILRHRPRVMPRPRFKHDMKAALSAALSRIDDPAIAAAASFLAQQVISATTPAGMTGSELIGFLTLLLVCITGGGIGACCGVLVSAVLPGKELCHIAESKRKLANWAGAAGLGPFIAYYAASHWFPEVPLPIVGLATGFLTGIFFVSVLCLIPWRALLRRLYGPQNNRARRDTDG